MHHEGLRISLIDEAMLDQDGVLTGVAGSSQSYGLPDGSVRLFLLIAGAGELGLLQSKLPKDMKDCLNEHLLPLEMQSLVGWERDNRGRLAYLVLTWKGREALDAARPKPQQKTNIAARRRASVQG